MKKFILIIFYFYFASNLLAEFSLNITPSVIQDRISSGEQKSYQIKVQNYGKDIINFKIDVFSLDMDVDGSIKFFRKAVGKSCASWINLQRKEVTIKPNDIELVNVKINIPTKIEGGNYAGILFKPTSQIDFKSNIKLDLQAVVLVSLISPYNTKRGADLSTIEIVNQNASTRISVLFENTSNIHIRPKGSIIIFDRDNSVVDRLPLDKNNFLLPKSKRIFQFFWNNTVKRRPNEIYRARCRINVPGIAKTFMVEKEFSTID